MRNVALVEEFARTVRVADDHTTDRGLGGFRDAEGENNDVVVIEKANNFEQGTDFVLEENGKLAHLGAVEFLGGGGSHIDSSVEIFITERFLLSPLVVGVMQVKVGERERTSDSEFGPWWRPTL